MNEKDMREILERRPFVPVVATLSSGQQLTIDHPEHVLLTKTKMVVSYPERDVITWAPLLHVASAESHRPSLEASRWSTKDVEKPFSAMLAGNLQRVGPLFG